MSSFTTKEARASSGQAWSHQPCCCQVHQKLQPEPEAKSSVEAWQRGGWLALQALEDYYLIGGQPDELPCSDASESHKAIVPGIKGSCGAWSPSARCRGTQRWSVLGFMKKFEYLQERQVNPSTRHAHAGTLAYAHTDSQVKCARPFLSSNPLDWSFHKNIW